MDWTISARRTSFSFFSADHWFLLLETKPTRGHIWSIVCWWWMRTDWGVSEDQSVHSILFWGWGWTKKGVPRQISFPMHSRMFASSLTFHANEQFSIRKVCEDKVRRMASSSINRSISEKESSHLRRNKCLLLVNRLIKRVWQYSISMSLRFFYFYFWSTVRSSCRSVPDRCGWSRRYSLNYAEENQRRTTAGSAWTVFFETVLGISVWPIDCDHRFDRWSIEREKMKEGAIGDDRPFLPIDCAIALDASNVVRSCASPLDPNCYRSNRIVRWLLERINIIRIQFKVSIKHLHSIKLISPERILYFICRTIEYLEHQWKMFLNKKKEKSKVYVRALVAFKIWK